MVLKLECPAESPGGLFKTDCWAPCPHSAGMRWDHMLMLLVWRYTWRTTKVNKCRGESLFRYTESVWKVTVGGQGEGHAR